MKNKTTNGINLPSNSPTLIIENELSRNFMEYARDQLFAKEMQVMMESSLLIETLISKSLKHETESSQKDYSFSKASRTMDTLMTEEDEEPRIRLRPFTRKTAKGPQLQIRINQKDQNMEEALDEIKQNCSRKTFSIINNFAQNYNKLRKSINDTKVMQQQNISKNSLLRPRPETDRSGSDQAIILAAKNVKLEKQNSNLNTKIKQLEEKIEALNSKFKEQINMRTNQSFGYVKEYFDNREKKLQTFSSKVENIYKGFVTGLQTQIIDGSCNKCCNLVKKVKGSLINYKQCLGEEIEYYKELWYGLHIKHKNDKQNKPQNELVSND